MPIFGLVWVASWVSCFFSSSQDLLQAPSHLSCALPIQAHTACGPRNTLLAAATRFQSNTASSVAVRATLVSQVTPASSQAALPTLALGESLVTLPSNNLLTSIKSFFSDLQRLAISPPPPVVVTPVTHKTVINQPAQQVDRAGVGFGQCRRLLPDTSDDAVDGDKPGHLANRRFFQITIKHRVVGEAASRQQATKMAHQLERILQGPKNQLARLQPTLVNGLPAGKLDDRVLFTIDQTLADQWDCNPEMLAIAWVNNLRQVVAEPPLSLADAQAKMYGLQATGETIDGLASWYGPYFHGRQTATGETFNQNDFTAAHPSLPFGTYLRVTNVENGRSVIVRVNDRGPYFENRTLDLSREAALCLGSTNNGVVEVEAEIMQAAPKAERPSQTIARL